jgi:hypothetical protein
LGSGSPELAISFSGSLQRTIHTPRRSLMFYERVKARGDSAMVVGAPPQLRTNILQWLDDSRGHWKGSTLVVDVMNFRPNADFPGSRENLRLMDR